jgi:hypothetical protein
VTAPTVAEPVVQVVQYATPSSVGAANQLAKEGWLLHSTVTVGSQVWFVMHRQTDVETIDAFAELDKSRAHVTRLATERAGLCRDLAKTERQLAVALDNGEALTAERDQLTEQVRRVGAVKPVRMADGDWIVRADDIKAALNGGDVLAEMTPGEMLQVRRADPADGGS